MTDLRRTWLARLPATGSVDLAAGTEVCPELAEAVRPVGYSLAAVEGMIAGNAGEGYLEAEFLARLVPPGVSPSTVVEGALGAIDLSFDTETSQLRLDTLDVPEVVQTFGLGRLVMGQLALLADDLRLATIELEAGKVGRWAWMRCGFDFADPTWRNSVVREAERFARSLGREVDLSPVQHSWDFLRFTEVVSPEEILAAGGPTLLPPDKPVALGKALLLGPDPASNAWMGRLDLERESPGRVRLDNYVLGDDRSASA